MLKIGIIGAGIISKKHADAIQKLEQTLLIGVADIVPEKAKNFEESYGAKAYIDYREMVKKEKLDAVVICLPHGLHKEAAVYCAEHGVHILIEKPMANTVEECERIIQACEKNKVKLMIGHIQRYFSQIRKAKELLHSGDLGELVMITDNRNTDYFNENRPKWFLSKKLAGGGIVMNFGAHSFDKLLWITERTIEKITASISQHFPQQEVEGNAQILVELEGNVSATISFSGYNVPSVNEMVIYMTKGIIKINSDSRVLVSYGGEFIEVKKDSQPDSFVLMWKDFIDAIHCNHEPQINGIYGKEIIRAIEAVYRV